MAESHQSGEDLAGFQQALMLLQSEDLVDQAHDCLMTTALRSLLPEGDLDGELM